MKAVWGKTVSGISSFTRGTYNVLTFSRLRHSHSEDRGGSDEIEIKESSSVNGAAANSHDRSSQGWSIMSASYTPPPPHLQHITQEDDILYRKNNVYLKCEVEARAKSDSSSSLVGSSGSSSPAIQSLRLLQQSANSTPQPTEEKVPGFLFIASRGSNYGSTLILNWAPNSTMIQCSGSINSHVRTTGESSNNELTSSSEKELNQREHAVASALTPSTPTYPIHPSSSSQPSEHKCVSIDLGDMEMIRVFYHTDNSDSIVSGEMVVSSKQSNFWVFHFQNGGLTDLIHLFCSWKYFSHQQHRESHQHTFSVFRPKLSLSELHPHEKDIRSVLTEDMWQSLFDPDGRITESRCVKKVVFFKGVYPSLRKEVWPFLLGLYKFDSSERDRDADRLEHCKRYWAIDDLRRKIETEDRGSVDMSIVDQIEIDVRRTDRSNPYYSGEGNRHVGALKHILLNYVVHKPDIGYCQGMTDLLAPLLAALDNEVEAFWCFEKLVESSAYFKPAKNSISVEKQLDPLRMLIKLLLPWFYSYLDSIEYGLTLMFCHRWLLVCLKREFSEKDTLTIWEACWTNYETNSFHLFICVAVMAIYGQKAVEKEMNINELIVFFNTLSLTMPCDLVLTQARGYLHQFSTSPSIHCTLRSVMPESFWDNPRSPKLECGLCGGLDSSCKSRDPPSYFKEAMC